MDKDTTKSTFFEVLNQFPYEEFCFLIKANGVDKYIKKLFAPTLFYIMFIAQICQIESLRAMSAKVSNDTELQNVLGIGSISSSQLSRRLKDINSDHWGTVFTQVASKTMQASKKSNPLPHASRIHIIDASTITLCLNTYRWADYRSTKAGVKIHQRVVYQDGSTFPDKAILTNARESDISKLDELLITDPNALYLFDRGYVNYSRWDDYCDAGIRFVTRTKDNFLVNIIDEKPIAGTDMTESIVLLGEPKKTMMRHKLRIIHTKDSTGRAVEILTNDFNMSAFEISEAYRLRWSIELFFKWIKQHLKVKRFYGQSPNAVFGQIWLTLISFCLTLLVQLDFETKKSLLEIQRLLKDNLFKPFSDFLDKLRRQPARSSKGRKKFDYNQEFEQLLQCIETDSSINLDVYDVDLNCL